MNASVLVADPPWKFGDSLPGKGRGAEKHYRCLTVEDIARFPLPTMAPDCVLFLWRVASMQDEALLVARTWGFTVKSELVWVKTTKTGKPRIGMGRTVRNAHEVCLIATRGRPKVLDRSVPSVIFAPRGRHSAKPDVFYQTVERLYAGPYVELFARAHRPGWLCDGLEVDGSDEDYLEAAE